MDARSSLNEAQKRRLRVHCEYADRLLSEIESILAASESKSPFPKFRPDVSPVQNKFVRNSIARIRAQMLRALESQGIQPPGPQFGSVHVIRVNLSFVRNAFVEMEPHYLRGYGEVPEELIPELNGLAEELNGLVDRLDSYLAQGLGSDLAARLERLNQTQDEVALLRLLERIISERGFVELRPTLSMIVERLESQRYEIAVFGRVSSGKSSLLNHILGTDVLPVGVNPITAVPTRIIHGPKPKLTVGFVNRRPEASEIARLPEFVSEAHNPGNTKAVTKIVVELPADRLETGLAFVDTPGLGSLATAGAAETLAYLPQCDLGVVLINASTTLSEEDLSTIATLYEAAVPVQVLLSKADLLEPDDRASAVNYVALQIRSRLGLDLRVHPVSIVGSHAELLEDWFAGEIQPMCLKHEDLAQQSVRRKAGALRDSVEAALGARLAKTGASSTRRSVLLDAEASLRKAAGQFNDTLRRRLEASDRASGMAPLIFERAGAVLVDLWSAGSAGDGPARAVLDRVATETVAELGNQAFEDLGALAASLTRALEKASYVLKANEVPSESEMKAPLKEMPRLDLGTLTFRLRPPWFLFWKSMSRRSVARSLERASGRRVGEALSTYGRLLETWSRKVVEELQTRFDAHADAYRAQLARLVEDSSISPEEQKAARRDLVELAFSGARTWERSPIERAV